jgi:cysteinyl-tRNA synthetase
LDQNISGFRVDNDEYEKQDASDFVLWKNKKETEPFWSSPFGEGRPGWHIECSAMSMKYLGETFDVHTGGEDNIFPHHENEIAQSEGATGKTFVNYWLHCKFLLVEGEKMSKSKGNFYTLRDLVKKSYSPVAIRYLLLSHNYRHPLNFTFTGLEQALASIMRMNEFVHRVRTYTARESSRDDSTSVVEKARTDFEAALDDDLNIAQGVAVIFEFISEVNKKLDCFEITQSGQKMLESFMNDIDRVLGVLTMLEADVPQEITNLINERNAARKAKNFSQADAIRKKITEQGWTIEDTPGGTRAKKLI